MQTWTITLGDDAARLLDELARARNEADPDAFGPVGHQPNLLVEACALGLALVGRVRTGWQRRCDLCGLNMFVDQEPDPSALDCIPDCVRCGNPDGKDVPWKPATWYVVD